MQELLKVEGFSVPTVSTIYKFLVEKGKSNRVTDDRAKSASAAGAVECKRTMADLDHAPEQLLFLDETHKTSRDYKRCRGWFDKGTKEPVTTSFQMSDKPVSVVACIDINGFVMSTVEAYEENMDGQAFLDHFIRFVYPILGDHMRREPHSTLVVDNAPAHRSNEAEHVIEHFCRRKGAMLAFLPRCQPTCNPIELAFGRVKKCLKSRKDLLRDDPHAHLMWAFEQAAPKDASGYFRKAECSVPA